MDSMDTDKHWHLKKELNLGHILTTLMLMIGIIAWGNTMDQRVTRLEVQTDHVQKGLLAANRQCNELRNELLIELRSLRGDVNRMYQRADGRNDG